MLMSNESNRGRKSIRAIGSYTEDKVSFFKDEGSSKSFSNVLKPKEVSQNKTFE